MTQNAKEISRGERFAVGASRARFLNILVNQSYPIRFVLSRLLRYSGLWRLFKIKREGYKLPAEFYRRHLETGLQPKRPVKV